MPVPEEEGCTAAARGLRQKREKVVPTYAESICLTEPGHTSQAGQVRALSMEAFGEDATRSESKAERVATMLLEDEVLGYASYTVRPGSGSLNIQKLVVARAHRRRGLGRCLLKYLTQLAKRPQPPPPGSPKKGRGAPLEVVCLSSLAEAVAFYKACGFREEPGVALPEDDADELIEGQVYMELPLRKRRK